MSANKILVVDDEPDIRSLVGEILEDEGYQVATAENGEQARKLRDELTPALILLDIWMPDIDGISLLKEWKHEEQLTQPIIMMSGHGTVETAVEATRLGAYDYLEKPLSMAKLLLTIKNAMQAIALKEENTTLKQDIPALSEPVGKSTVIEQLRNRALQIAKHAAPVLLTGEEGSGKQLFARYIHTHSNHHEGQFVTVAASSIANKNQDTELFGLEDGDKIYRGRLEQANSGTLFLDEIADMELETQAKLIGAIESQQFTRVGGITPITVNVRIIAASQDNLEEHIESGTFRRDLYYYLNVVPLHIPPLREHMDDLQELLRYSVDSFVTHQHLPYREFSVGAQNRLRQHSWQGNVQELNNVVQRLLIMGDESEVSQHEVDDALTNAPILENKQLPESVTGLDMELPLKEAREQFEKLYILHHLQECGGNISKLAQRVGVERTNLYRKLKTLNIDPKQR